MKTRVLSILPLFLFGWAASWGASADPKDLPFLRKLNKAYYCLSDQGFKSFTCDAKVEVSDWWAQEILAKAPVQGALYAFSQPKIHVSCGGPEEDVKVDYHYKASSGNPEWDEKLEASAKNLPVQLGGTLGLWNSFMWDPINSEKYFTTCGYKVNPLKEGYQVIQYFDSGTVITLGLDKDLKILYENVTNAKGDTETIKFTFKSSPQGYQLEEFKITNVNNPTDCKFKMAQAGKYLLPETIEVTNYNQDGETRKAGFVYSFSHYEVRP